MNHLPRTNPRLQDTTEPVVCPPALLRVPRPWTHLLLASLLLLAGLLGGCQARQEPSLARADVVEMLSVQPDPDFARAYERRPFRFPQDHGPHPAFRTEWWYFTGNLLDDQGRPYGFQLTFFRTGLQAKPEERASSWASSQLYMAHFAVTDGPGDRHVSFDRFSRGGNQLAGATGEPAFAVWLEDWSAQETAPGVFRLQASAATEEGPVALDLTLQETRPPLLHGDQGLSQKGPEPGNASYYYSLVGLETQGTLTLPRGPVPVTGVSWMDHEFGTSALSPDAVGWDWFGLQLEDGTVLMFAQIRTADGPPQAIFQGTLAWPDGRQEPIRAQDFQLEALERWTSPVTGITYPSGWRVRFPRFDLELTLEPIVRDQEMRVAFVYYEGAVRVAGTRAGQPVRGWGYVELTGYGGPGEGLAR